MTFGSDTRPMNLAETPNDFFRFSTDDEEREAPELNEAAVQLEYPFDAPKSPAEFFIEYGVAMNRIQR